MSKIEKSFYLSKKFKGIGIIFVNDYLGTCSLGYLHEYYYFEIRLFFCSFWIKIEKK